MRVAQLHRGDGIAHAGLLSQRAAFAQALVIHLQAQQTANHRAIGAMALPGFGEGTVKADIRLLNLLAQQLARDATNARRARRVRAAWADHHRAENVKQIHVRSSSFALYGL